MSRIRFSIVMPSLNQARFLLAAIDSVLRQDCVGGLELIIVDGGSDDGSLGILQSLDDPRVLWTSEADAGQADAINKGMARATGDVLAFLNSDDVYLEGALRRVADAFASHPQHTFLYGQGLHIFDQGDVIEPYPTRPWDFEALQESCYICQPTAFWRRELQQRHGGFDASLHYCFDYEYWLRIGASENVHFLDGQPIAATRIHPGTKTARKRHDSHLEAARMILHRVGNGPSYARWLTLAAHYWVLENDPAAAESQAREALALLQLVEREGLPLPCVGLANISRRLNAYLLG